MFWSFHPSPDKTSNEHLPKPFIKVIRKSLYLQGFRQVCKVADIFLRALDAKVFGSARRFASVEDASSLGESGGMLPLHNFNRLLRNAVSSVSGTQESVSQARLEFNRILRNEKSSNSVRSILLVSYMYEFKNSNFQKISWSLSRSHVLLFLSWNAVCHFFFL